MFGPSCRARICVVLPLLLPVACQAQLQGLRWSFGAAEVGTVPRGWSCAAGTGRASVVADEKLAGNYCLLLEPRSGAAAQPPGTFATVMQSIPRGDFGGRRLRLSASVRLEGGDDTQAQLWLRADLPENKRGFFDNMADRPITATEWGRYEITGDIPAETERLAFGLLLTGSGRAWLDNVALEIVNPIREQAVLEAPRPLTEQGLQNVIAFARLWGLVRHFHPADEAAAADWQQLAVEGVRQAEAAADAAGLCRVLQEVFAPVAPSVRVGLAEPALPAELSLPPQAVGLRVAHWKHLGYGQHATAKPPYTSTRLREPAGGPGVPDPARPYRASLGQGLSCLVPLALYADAEGTLPHAPARAAADALPTVVRYTANDRATRLAAAIEVWNVMRYFYPYFDVVQTDWDAALPVALRAAATDAGEVPFLYTLRRLVAALHDGHGHVFHSCDPRAAIPAVRLQWIENRAVVTGLGPGAEGLHYGDALIRLDGRPVAELVPEAEELICGATPQWKHYWAMSELLAGPRDSRVALEVQAPNGATREVTLRRDRLLSQAPPERRPDKIATLEPGIMYVDIDRLNDEDFAGAVPQLTAARGIIFDLRGYPSNLSTAPLAHLADQAITCARWNVPIITSPDPATRAFQFSNWEVKPVAPRFRARVAFLIDGRAISYAETYLGIVEHYKLAEIVGATTAGTNGNINPFATIGGYRVVWTGMKVLKHDGSQHHGVGIAPTVPVVPTIAGVAAGRDEVLQRALAVVKGQGG